ncbi:efflux RND transporter periplasmic adaptor subunit [Abyssibacter sp.]|uniref:efflux RND transporter periplasmic adaptor subunit n=1 Tax=Abyssibacter sp. TaxID=2320200 RepID=UPI000C4290C1|nr:efflux RND transporter periplasmic adaptor subunit [Abyssibacter sp.]MBB87781.1 efflux transporter periplasmic adaptor subunit [Xanthomonadales bacterium]MCK5860792.1 efflux RND transporter periplasmic adaptor subunit [Abyssibacter sp.]
MRPLLFTALLLPICALHAQPAPQATPVVVDHVRSERMVKAMPVSGTVHSRNEMQITASVAGRLEWLAEPGSTVQQGEAVARIDARPLRLQLTEQRALIERESVNHNYLEREVERQERLSSSNYVSVIDLEQARSQRDMAASDIEVAQARIAQLEDQILRATVTAPFTGVVVEQTHFVGEEVVRGASLSRLIDTAHLEVRAGVPLRLLGRTRPGDVLSVMVEGEELVGRIRTVVPAGNPQSQTFEIRVDLPTDDARRLAVGQITRVRVPISSEQSSLAVPRDALVLRQNGTRVVRINAQGLAEHVPVTLGQGRGSWISVQGQLAVGDVVAVRGAERLQPGQAVTVVRDLAEERDGVNRG